VGDAQSQFIIKDQPMKFAATEGIYKDTGKRAPWSIVEGIDAKGHKATWKVEIPDMLSVLSYHKTTGAVKGMDTINQELHAKYDGQYGKDMNYYVPPKTLFWSFRVMAGSGMLFALVSILGLIALRGDGHRIMKWRWLLYVLGICLWLPFAANTA